MDAAQIAVTIVGLLLMVGVAWFFFGERERTVARVAEGGVQTARVTVKGGYSPDTLVVKRARASAMCRTSGGAGTRRMPEPRFPFPYSASNTSPVDSTDPM